MPYSPYALVSCSHSRIFLNHPNPTFSFAAEVLLPEGYATPAPQKSERISSFCLFLDGIGRL